VRKDEAKMEPLDMAKVVDYAMARLEFVIEEFEAEIVQPKTWSTAIGYAPWVEEIWANYISNGLKYGGRPPRLELGCDDYSNGMVRFWVKDNGQGLTPEQQATLFTEFTRLNELQIEGHGLGLSIVRRIIEKLGGKVGVESEVNKGSLFYFTLPTIDEKN
jgi:signal transduction histidine kinase